MSLMVNTVIDLWEEYANASCGKASVRHAPRKGLLQTVPLMNSAEYKYDSVFMSLAAQAERSAQIIVDQPARRAADFERRGFWLRVGDLAFGVATRRG